MLPQAIRRPGYFALALLLIAPQAAALEAAPLPSTTAGAMAQAASAQAIAEYRRKLKEYLEARAAFDQEAEAYWNSIAEKRRGRNAKRRERQTIALDDYVLTQPPVYAGPRRPVNPSPEAEEPREPRERKRIPLVADLLKAAAEHFQFAPQRLARDLDCDRLQPAVDQQQRRADRRAGSGNRQGVDGKGRAFVREPAPGDGSQDRGAEADGGAGALGAGRMGAAREARQYAAGLGDPCHGAGYRCRPAAADPQAPHLRDLRPRQGFYAPAHRRRAGDDEPDRRWHRARHGDDAAADARAGPDLEFLPARRLRAQSGGDPQQHRGETAGGHRQQDGLQQHSPGREGAGRGVLGFHPPLEG